VDYFKINIAMRFLLTQEFIERTQNAIATKDVVWLQNNIMELHFADIADILDHLNNRQARYLYFLMDEELQSNVLMELDVETRYRFLASLSPKEFADQIEQLESDDAADLLGELPHDQAQKVIAHMQDGEAIEEVVDLLNYDEDTAGGLMQKEFIQTNVSWTVGRALVSLRQQAEDVQQVFTIYVVDDNDTLMGILSLKRLLFSTPKTRIADLYQDKNIISVKTNESAEEVAKIMEKYNLVSLPVVDQNRKLVGRITIDDMVDFIKEEADKDFQMATGISEKIEDRSSLWKSSRARLPWLLIAMVGGVVGSRVLASFEDGISTIPAMAFFIPLITAMGGNVGVQSSAIVVQSLAKDNQIEKSLFKRIGKETIVALANGIFLSTIIYVVAALLEDYQLALVVSVSLFTMIMFASVFGTLIPMAMNKLNIDPALATGPFVTTLNDIIGLSVYFTVGTLLYNL